MSNSAPYRGRMKWDRVEPVKPCTSPDGHEYCDLMNAGSTVPVCVLCPSCGEPWQVVVMPEDDDA